MNEVYVFDHVRTPRGKGRPDGALHEVPPVQLAASVLQALQARLALDTRLIDEVGLGVVMPVGEQGADLARTAALMAGYDEAVAGYQLNRFCTSALDTLKLGAALIASGQADAVVGGGVESMSRVPIGSDGGASYTDPNVGRRFPYIPNGVAADLMATRAGLGRQDLDAYALQSQQRATHALAQGHFARSVIPVLDMLGQTVLAQDEAVRPKTTMADLARLKPAFDGLGAAGYDEILLRRYPELDAIAHHHTSGNASGIVDGACAVLLGSARLADRAGLRPRAKVRAVASGASEPLISLGGPMPVSRRALAQCGMSVHDIDLFEVNEAFAVVPLCFMQDMDVPPEKVNVNGGAIALGHPLGATGAILLGTVLDELERRGLGTALVTLCAAAGQATTLVMERV
jgi:acetyl-CoA C-acetyltransferase